MAGVRHGRWRPDNRPSFPAEVALWVDLVDGAGAEDAAGDVPHAPECGEYGFCDGGCRRGECEGCGDFGLCDGTCRLQWCDGGCSGQGYCDGTCERERAGRQAGVALGATVVGARHEAQSLFGERGAELAAGIRSFADLTTDEVRAWARSDGSPARDRPEPGRSVALSPVTPSGADPAVPRREPCADPGPLVLVDAGSAEFAGVWPARHGGLEPRPGLLTSVVRAGTVLIYPPPLFDPRVAVATRTGVWPVLDEPPAGGVADAVAGPVPAPIPAPVTAVGAVPGPPLPEAGHPPEAASQKAYVEIRQLVGVLVEVMAGRRSPQQVALWVHARVREALRDPATSRYGGTAVLRRVRLSTVGSSPDTGVEALALVQDGTRMRAAAFRFDAVADPGRATTGTARWLCTALQTA